MPIPFLLSVTIALSIIFFGWRIFSRRSSLPCPSWLAWMVELDNPFAADHNARSIVGRLGILPGMKVLDAGCGPGRLTIPLAQAAGERGEVTAVDIQPEMLHRTRVKADAAGLANIRYIERAIGPRSIGSDIFDRAVLVTVLGEIPDRQGAIEEIYRSLKPGGILSVTEIIFDPHYQSKKTVLTLAHTAGFREKGFFGGVMAFTIHLEKPLNGYAAP